MQFLDIVEELLHLAKPEIGFAEYALGCG